MIVAIFEDQIKILYFKYLLITIPIYYYLRLKNKNLNLRIDLSIRFIVDKFILKR